MRTDGGGASGPNHSRDEVARTIVYARALTAWDNRSCEFMYAIRLAQRERAEEFPPDVWHGAVRPDGSNWYWRVDADGLSGESTSRLPEGAVLGTMLTVPRDTRPVFDRFTELLNNIEAGKVLHGSPPSTAELATLQGAKGAAQDGSGSRLTSGLLTPVRSELSQNKDVGTALARLRKVLDHLTGLRRRFGADLTTIVGLGWSIQLMGQALNAANASPEQAMAGAKVLLGTSEVDPMELLSKVASAMLDHDLNNLLLAAADRSRQISQNLADKALGQETQDGHLNGLYGALPHTFASLVLYKFLAEHGPQEERSQRRKAVRLLDERAVRQYLPFSTQLLDLDGETEWRRHRMYVARSRAEDGQEGADRALRFIIDENLFYPRAFAPLLLAADEAAPAPQPPSGA